MYEGLSGYLNFSERILESRKLSDHGHQMRWPDQSTLFLVGTGLIFAWVNFIALVVLVKTLIEDYLQMKKRKLQEQTTRASVINKVSVKLGDGYLDFPETPNEVLYFLHEDGMEINVEFLKNMLSFLTRSFNDTEHVRKEVLSFEFDIN